MIYTLPALILWCIFIAEREATTDALDILANKPIFHTEGWITRTIFCGAGAGFAAIPAEEYLTTFYCCLCVAYGAFTSTFRFLLNRKRGLHWLYVSESNMYDRMLIHMAGISSAGIVGYGLETFVLILCSFIIFNL